MSFGIGEILCREQVPVPAYDFGQPQGVAPTQIKGVTLWVTQ